MKKNILCSFLCLLSAVAFAQSITLTPTSAGTNTEGKMFYSTSTHLFYYWNGTSFVALGNSAGIGWSAIGSDISNSNTGNVGIGLSSPASKLHVQLGVSGVSPTATTSLFLENSSDNYLNIATPNGYTSGVLFGKNSIGNNGGIVYSSTNNMSFATGGIANRMIITSTGLVGISNNNALELGYGIVGKETSAGKIGYGFFTANTLDIVGAGNNYASRKIRFWAEGGSTFEGNVNTAGYTKMGESSPSIKTKLLRGTFGSVGNFFEIDHGLNMHQIVAVDIHLSHGATIPQYISENFNNYFWHIIRDTTIGIGANDLPSGTTLANRKYQIFITYQDDTTSWF